MCKKSHSSLSAGNLVYDVKKCVFCRNYAATQVDGEIVELSYELIV